MGEEKKQEMVVREVGVYLPNTFSQFLTTYNPINCREELRLIRGVKDSIRIKTPSVGSIVRTYGRVKIEAYIKVWLIDLNESLNLKRPLKEHQIDECAFRIVDRFKNISIGDMNLVFGKAKSGDYGEFYESVSMSKILKWFSDYFNEKCEVAGSMSRMKSDGHKYTEQKSKRVSEMRDVEFEKFNADYIVNKIKENGIKR